MLIRHLSNETYEKQYLAYKIKLTATRFTKKTGKEPNLIKLSKSEFDILENPSHILNMMVEVSADIAEHEVSYFTERGVL